MDMDERAAHGSTETVVNFLLRLDRAQLAAADAAVAWLWDVAGVPRRMLLRMALVGQFLTQALAEIVVEGRVELLTLAAAALVMGFYHLNDMRLGADPELQRALTLARRERPISRAIRAFVWLLAAYDLFNTFGSRAAPLEVLSTGFFMVFMIGGDALTPGGPRKRRRRRTAAAPSKSGPAPAFPGPRRSASTRS